MKKFIAAAAFACIFGAAYADYEKGLAAYQRKEFAIALQEFNAAAAVGDAKAQRYLGVMYGEGHGVTKNDVEAVRWYRMAADQGDADA